MNFDEWWEQAKVEHLVPAWGSNKESAKLAWAVAATHEREACAKVCEGVEAESLQKETERDFYYGRACGAAACVLAIRARE